jgi:methionyl aminopeptidase
LKAGKIAREVREWVESNVKIGSGYLEICVEVENEIVKRGGEPAFPCGIGVNHITAHYAPQDGEKGVIREDDVIKLDFGVHIDGYIADTAITISYNAGYQSLLEATQRALQVAIEVSKRDQRIGEISRAIANEASRRGFKPISNLSGHTLERYVVHAGKSIPNLYMPNLPILKRDEIFAIEPFLTLGEASGYVIDAPHETIFSLIARKRTGNKDMDELIEIIWNRRKTLPFTPRWFEQDYKYERLIRLLKELEGRKLVRSYPTLVEASNQPVAQFEHTIALVKDGLLVLT